VGAVCSPELVEGSTAIYSVSRVGLDPAELVAGYAVLILQFCGSLFNQLNQPNQPNKLKQLNQLNQPNKPNKLNKLNNSMNSDNPANKIDDDLIVCRCESIGLGQIQASIHRSGAQTVNQVKKLTRAGMGLCQGRTCAKVVESILTSEGKMAAGTEPYQVRPPVRSIPVAALAQTADYYDEPAGPVSIALTRSADDEASE